MSAPTFAPVDDDTADLLTMLAEDQTPLAVARDEWALFVAALDIATHPFDRTICQTILRDKCRDSIPPHKVGPFTRRALAEGLIEWRGEWEPSTDKAGGNTGKPTRIYRRSWS